MEEKGNPLLPHKWEWGESCGETHIRNNIRMEESFILFLGTGKVVHIGSGRVPQTVQGPRRATGGTFHKEVVTTKTKAIKKGSGKHKRGQTQKTGEKSSWEGKDNLSKGQGSGRAAEGDVRGEGEGIHAVGLAPVLSPKWKEGKKKRGGPESSRERKPSAGAKNKKGGRGPRWGPKGNLLGGDLKLGGECHAEEGVTSM